MVTIKNRKTGVESEVSAEKLKDLQSNAMWSGAFSVVEDKTPKEVKKMTEEKNVQKVTSTVKDNKPA